VDALAVEDVEGNMEHNHTKLKDYLPLAVITLFAAALSGVLMKSQEEFMYRFMGFFLATFALFKWIDIKGFISAFREYDLLSKIFKPHVLVYPVMETALGLSYISLTLVHVSNYVLLVLMAINAASVITAVFKKRSITCACLGTTIKLPLSIVSLYEIALMIFMAIWMIKHN
jgi:hypothetical protein